MNTLTAKAYKLSLWVSTFIITGVSFFSLVGTASAAMLTARSFTLGSSAASATTSYTFAFTTATTATIQSFQAQICTTASGACTTPGGFSVSSPGSTFTSSSLSGTWTVSNATPGSLRASASSATSTTAASAKNMVFGNVANPSATNATFFARITLYSDTGWSTPVDSGVTASSTAGLTTVTASVDETLTFTLADSTVALGTITPSTTGSGTSTMSASTNATSGYTITVNGVTLTDGGNTIAALSGGGTSAQGTSQFGLNLVDNATPNVGADPSGGTGAAAAGYDTADNFKFATGNTVASVGAPTNATTYTVSYIANVGGAQAAGAYSTTLTYIATATY